MALKRIENDAVIRKDVHRSGFCRERRRDQAQALGRSALLVTEHTAQMQGVEVARIARESGVVYFSASFEIALLVQSQRQLDGGRRRRALLGCVLRHSGVTEVPGSISQSQPRRLTRRKFSPNEYAALTASVHEEFGKGSIWRGEFHECRRHRQQPFVLSARSELLE